MLLSSLDRVQIEGLEILMVETLRWRLSSKRDRRNALALPENRTFYMFFSEAESNPRFGSCVFTGLDS